MYREVISRKKLPLIVIMLCVVTIMLYIQEILYLFNHYSKGRKFIIDCILICIIIGILLFEIRLARISYKYSLIAGKLIINKIMGTKENNEVSLKVVDIIYVGTSDKLPSKYKHLKSRRNFCCNYLDSKRSICVYKDKEDIKSFSFSPSDCMINKIKSRIEFR